MPKSSLHITHDAFLKRILADRGAAIAFMRAFLPTEVLEHLEVESYVPATNSFITEEMESRLADIIFEVPVKGSDEKVMVSVLVELKSSPDKYTTFQLLEYIALGYRKQIREKHRLQLIIPVIYYHGKRNWVYQDISTFFHEYPQELTLFIPQHSSLFINLKNKTDQEIRDVNNNLLRTALYVQILRFLELIDMSVLARTFAGMVKDVDRNYFHTIIVYALSKSNTNPDLFIKFMEDFPQDIKEEAMTTAEQLKQQGREQGIEQGIEQGMEQGRAQGYKRGIEQKTIEVVKQCYKNNISISMIANIAGISEQEVVEIVSHF
jgi:predicted transposase/invertase (TIGR01784 family)